MNKILLMLVLTATPVGGYAVETAQRISDREIIESLAQINGQLKSMDQRFDAMEKQTADRT